MRVAGAGGQIIVSPNMNPDVIGCAKSLVSSRTRRDDADGSFRARWTPGDVLKLFPGEMISPAAVRAIAPCCRGA